MTTETSNARQQGQAAPPSAPVGADAPGSRAWMAEVCRAAALSLAAHDVHNDQLSKVADWIAQQPAPSEPVEVGAVFSIEVLRRVADELRRADALANKSDKIDRRKVIGRAADNNLSVILSALDSLSAQQSAAKPDAVAGLVEKAHAGCTIWRGSLRVSVTETEAIEYRIDADEAFCNLVQRALDSLAAAWDAAALATKNQEPTT